MFLKVKTIFKLAVFKNSSINKVLSECCSENASLYVYGGFVRDTAIGRQYGDIDYVLFGMDMADFIQNLRDKIGAKTKIHVSENGQNVSVYIQNKNGVFPIDINKSELLLKEFMEKNTDITVNGAVYKINSFQKEFIYKKSFFKDIKSKIIRGTDIDNKLCKTSFPRHFSRYIRLAIKLGFKIDKLTLDSIVKYKHLVSDISPEKVKKELLKAFSLPNSSSYLDISIKTGLAFEMMPFLREVADIKNALKVVASIDNHKNVLPKHTFSKMPTIEKDKIAMLKLASLFLNIDSDYKLYLRELTFNEDEISFIENMISSVRSDNNTVALNNKKDSVFIDLLDLSLSNAR